MRRYRAALAAVRAAGVAARIGGGGAQPPPSPLPDPRAACDLLAPAWAELGARVGDALMLHLLTRAVVLVPVAGCGGVGGVSGWEWEEEVGAGGEAGPPAAAPQPITPAPAPPSYVQLTGPPPAQLLRELRGRAPGPRRGARGRKGKGVRRAEAVVVTPPPSPPPPAAAAVADPPASQAERADDDAMAGVDCEEEAAAGPSSSSGAAPPPPPPPPTTRPSTSALRRAQRARSAAAAAAAGEAGGDLQRTSLFYRPEFRRKPGLPPSRE